MATSKLIMRKQASTLKKSPITLLINYGAKNLKYSTDVKLLEKHWNQKTQTIRNVAELSDRKEVQAQLNRMKKESLEIFNTMYAQGNEITNQTLRFAFDKKFKSSFTETEFPTDLIGYIDYFLANAGQEKLNKANSTEPRRETTLKGFRVTKKKIEAYEKHHKNKVSFIKLNKIFHGEFISFLEHEHNLSPETVGSRIKDIKTIANHAKNNGLDVCPDVFTKEFYKPKKQVDLVDDIFLTPTEIERITNLNIKETDTNYSAWQWLLIGLWTGQRVGDFLNLTQKNIQGNQITLKQSKTGNSVIIPIHPTIKNILKSNNAEFPKSIAEATFNKRIKDICELAEITEPTLGFKRAKNKQGQYRKTLGTYPKNELVTSHSCRRSFATNHYEKLPLFVIMNITGHKTEITFMKYLKKTKEDSSKILAEFWKN